MKILHIINNLDKGGAERLLVETLPLYKSLGYDMSLLQLSSRHSSENYLAKLASAGITCSSLGDGSVYNPLLIFRLKQYLESHRFDCIHVHLFPAMYFAILSTLLTKRLCTGFIFTEHSTVNRRLENKWWRWLDRYVYIRYDRIIAISQPIAEKLKEHYKLGAKILIIPNGLNLEQINKLPALTKVQLTNNLGIPVNTCLLFMAARFAYPKDQISVVKALKFLPENYHLLLAGEGELLKKVEELIEEEALVNRVHLLGFRDDAIRIMKAVDINILSSAYEGLSGVAIEALASGKPFLGTDVPGINDVVPDSRFLFSFGDVNGLADRIIHITEHAQYASAMVKDAVQYVKQYDIHRMLSAHTNLYEEVVHEKKAE
ncbi:MULTISPECIES: glycosyltransferase [Olivibacter]|uniref:Glycosyltransferase n=1 Tax=Olivibacter jilunii TaxID=985016 RepID=A0ABW6BB51_9SPHI|nr:glycosyltransferase [Olivibacter sp. UJ_SKK_5.1]MDX3912663.1 glycosyltransferase [Pseudosphingobacterium sp.]